MTRTPLRKTSATRSRALGVARFAPTTDGTTFTRTDSGSVHASIRPLREAAMSESAENDRERVERGLRRAAINQRESPDPTPTAENDVLMRLADLLDKEPWHRDVEPRRLAELIRKACVIP